MEALLVLIALASISVSVWNIFRRERPPAGTGPGQGLDPREAQATAERLAQAYKARTGADPAGVGVVVLRDNFWEETVFDGVPVAWLRCAKGPRGLRQVHAGRHRVETRVRGVPIVHDFVLRREELYLRRLDLDRQAFVALEPEEQQRFSSLAGGGQDPDGGAMRDALYDYLGLRMRRDWPDTAPVLAEVRAGLLALLSPAAAGTPAASLPDAARALGERLVGVPLGDRALDDLVALAGSHVSGLAARATIDGRAPDAALEALELVLAVLPGDPVLLELQANLLSDCGRPQQALPVLEEASRRLRPEQTDLRKKLQATRAEVLARLGRHAEAQAELAELAARHPGDAHVAEVAAQVERLRTVQQRDS